jgi:hypothetical protein
MDFAKKFGIPVFTLLIAFIVIFFYTVIPYIPNTTNELLLYPIITMNAVISIALFFLLFVYNTDFQQNIIQISLIFTFLIALPITLASMGTSSIMYSN